MSRLFPLVASVVAVLWSSGCSEESCVPGCRPGFECFHGVCLPAGPDAISDVPADADDGTDIDLDANPDADGDGVPNTRDNCPTVANPDQANCDRDMPGGDAQGDACDEDDDADTIPDTIDLCSCTVPGDTHDEDRDGLVDECDNCPEISNPDQRNGDGDVVGDACEHPEGPGLVSERAEFISFMETPGFNGSPPGAWIRADDALVELLTAGQATATSRTWTYGDDAMLRTIATWTEGTDASYRLVGVLLRVQGTPPADLDWYFCCANAIDDSVQIWLRHGGATELISSMPLGGTDVENGSTLGIVGSMHGNEIVCAVETPSGPVILRAVAPESLSGSAGVRTYGTSATFSSFTVYR